MPAELAPVKGNLPEEIAEKDLSGNARKFRDIIEQFKNQVYEKLESGKGLDKHDVGRLNEAVGKIVQFGNIIKLYLLPQKELKGGGSEQTVTQESIYSINELFKSKGIDFSNLSPEEQKQFEYIIDMDTKQFPYSIKGKHTESLRRK